MEGIRTAFNWKGVLIDFVRAYREASKPKAKTKAKAVGKPTQSQVIYPEGSEPTEAGTVLRLDPAIAKSAESIARRQEKAREEGMLKRVEEMMMLAALGVIALRLVRGQ